MWEEDEGVCVCGWWVEEVEEDGGSEVQESCVEEGRQEKRGRLETI